VLQTHVQHPNQPITRPEQGLLEAVAFALIEADEASDDVSRGQRGLEPMY
jgi:hypothetical protein